MVPIIVNHLGFRPDDPFKRALMPLTGDRGAGFLGGYDFQVIEASRLIQAKYNTPEWLERLHYHMGSVERSPMGDFAVCDFSDLKSRGGYQIFCGDARSYPFLIYRDAWKRCFRILLEWYRIASCGEAVPGYHEQCHLDDCRLDSPTGRQVDLAGGWHDAGDLRKWTSTMAEVTWALTWLTREQGAGLPALAVDPEFVYQQIARGARYLLKTVDPETKAVWHCVASDDDNTCNVWTDNKPGSGDERVATRKRCLPAAEAYVRAQAAAAVALRERNPELAATALGSALAVFDASGREIQDAEGIEALVPMALELHRATSDRRFREIVVKGLDALLARQVIGPCFGQGEITGFFATGGAVDFNGDFRRRSGRSLFAFAARAGQLAEALLAFPRDPEASRWRDALQALLTGCLEPMLRRHPYRVLPASLYRRGACPWEGHEAGGELMFRYFGMGAEGNNCELLTAGGDLALAARALGEPKWAAYGQKHVEWVLGFNPHQECMMTGLGYARAGVFSWYVGQIPGGVINGYLGDEKDRPVLDTQLELAPMKMEYWSMHTAAMLRALSILENQPLS